MFSPLEFPCKRIYEKTSDDRQVKVRRTRYRESSEVIYMDTGDDGYFVGMIMTISWVGS